MRITHIRAKNFRCLGDVDLELRPFNVIIGPNGAGKSSFLELIRLFSGVEQLANGFAKWGGFPASLRYGAEEPSMKIGLGATRDAESVEYDLELEKEGIGFFVRSERLELRPKMAGQNPILFKRQDNMITLDDRGKTSGGSVGHGSGIALPNVRSNVPVIDEVLKDFRSISFWPSGKFDPGGKVRDPQQLQLATIPRHDGANLYSVLYGMKTERREAFRELVDDLRNAVPELDELDFPLAGAGTVSLTWRQKDVEDVFYSNQLSDGILRMIWLLTLLHAVPDDELVLIDEPELSLHPEWVMLITSILRKMSARKTIVAATQSAELVRWLEPEELIIADIGAEGACLSRADDRPDLKGWLEDFSLSELWTMGELGGRR